MGQGTGVSPDNRAAYYGAGKIYITLQARMRIGQERRVHMFFHREQEKDMRAGKSPGLRKAVLFFALFLVFMTVAGDVSLQAAVPKVTVTKKTLYVGYNSYQIRFKNLAKTATVTYASSDKKVAAVSSKGVIKPVAKGSATVTVTMKQGGKTYKGEIAVTVKESYISISNKKTKLVASSDYQLIGKAYGLDGAQFVFSTSDVLVAKVDEETGLLHARAAGKAKVTMKDKTSGKSVSFTVTVVKATEENAGDVYVTTEEMSKKYVYAAPKDTEGLTEEEAAKVKRLTDIQKRITAGASITIKEMQEYYIQKAADGGK